MRERYSLSLKESVSNTVLGERGFVKPPIALIQLSRAVGSFSSDNTDHSTTYPLRDEQNPLLAGTTIECQLGSAIRVSS